MTSEEKRIETGLANGKIFYLKGGKCLKRKQQEKAELIPSGNKPPTPAAAKSEKDSKDK